MMEVHFGAPPVVATTDILTTPEMYRKFFNSPAKDTIPTFLEAAKSQLGFQTAWGLPVEKARLLCGEYLYALFFAYRAFIGSIALHLAMGRDSGEFQSWWEFDHIRDLLKSTLTEEEFDEFQELKINRYTWVTRNFESKFLRAAQEIIDGRRAATDAFEQATEILAAAKNLDASK
jgi:hypothetical protein